jgi:predicted CopG family antitoxin
MDRDVAPKMFVKYKKVVNTFVLYSGNLSLIEINELHNGLSKSIIRSALAHYFQYPDMYDSKMINTNPQGNNGVYYSKPYKDVTGRPEHEKVENGLKTMLFWREVYYELKKLKEKNGNYYARKHQSFQILTAVNTVLQERNYEKDKSNDNPDERIDDTN